jgi:cell wall-associated NlpC family hydrolase
MRQQIVDFALAQQGARYKYAGRSPRTGFDCSGFTYYVMDNFGITLTPVSRVQEEEGQRIRIEEATAGDLVFFRRSRAGAVFHVALVISNDRDGLRVVHSTSSRGVVVDNIQESSYWRPKLSTARRVIR